MKVAELHSSKAGTIPYVFKRSKAFGPTELTLSVHVELYSKGSFRSINAYKGSYLGVTSAISDTSIEGKRVDVWSPDGYPTAELHYAYSGTIVATVQTGSHAEAQFKLKDSGFSFGGSMGTTTYYRRGFNNTGIIKLYDR